MLLLLFKATSISIIVATSAVGIWLAKHTRLSPQAIKLGESLTGGIFLGVALFHMLPDANHGFQVITTSLTQAYPLTLSLCSISFFTLLAVELTLTKSSSDAISYLLMFLLSSHSILAGAALGSYISIKPAVILFTAILLHKGLASFALATKLFNQINSNKQRNLLLTIFILMTPSGIVVASSISSLLHTQAGLILESSLNALAAGAFLYLGTWHKSARAIYKGQHQNPWLYRGVMLAGVLVLMALGGV